MSKSYPILFMGTPGFAVPSLKALHESDRFDVKAVISQPDRPAGRKMKLQASAVKQAALDLGLPVLTPETVNKDAIRQEILGYGAEAAVVVAFGQILGQKFLDLFPKTCVNLHGSLLPRWRGAAPIQRAIMEGDKESGVCLQVMVKKLDAGAVIAESKVTLSDTITAIELHDELSALGAKLLTGDFYDYLEGKISPVEQDETLVTYAAKLEKSEGLINWNLSAQKINQNIRGLTMGPGSFSFLNGKKHKIHHCQVYPGMKFYESSPGEIMAVEKDHLLVATGQGGLGIYSIQPESKPRMDVESYIRGYHPKEGERFQSQ